MSKFILVLFTVFLFAAISCTKQNEINRTQDFNFNWKFSLEKNENAWKADFDDTNWRTLNLPHDWSVEFPFDSINGEGCTAYLPGGIGWYRKHFDAEKDKIVTVLFDGVYNNSEIWINGEKLGFHPYGYSPFHFNLTPYLTKDGKNNVLAVKVDRTRFADSRWYTGSGIYRNVKLITTNKIHIPVWGTFITTPEVSDTEARVVVQTKVKNENGAAAAFKIVTRIINPTGIEVGNIETNLQLENGIEEEFTQEVNVPKPELWDIENPVLYSVISQIVIDGNVVDEYKSSFGIRTIKFDADEGFFLNGKNMKIKGVCLHHDGGLVGAAVPRGVWKRRLQILKDGGCNAIRISHNPASDEFLELCDEMGFLVQDEFFDEWDNPKDKRLNMHEQHDDYITRGYTEHFQEWAESDLKNTMLAHRNHPSVFQWSIGNEIEWTYAKNKKSTGFFNNMDWSGNYFWSQPPYSPEKIKEEYEKQPSEKYEIGNTAQKLAKWTKEMDTTRPVIANCILPSVSFISGYTDALDIVGFSYRRVMYDYAHKNYPGKIIMGTENLAQWHEWKAIMERDFVSGTFLWTGIDYMGESNGGWPRRNTPSGLLDQAGFEKPSYHMYKTLWQDKPHIYLCSQTADQSKYKVNSNGNVVEKNEGSWEKALWSWYSVNEHWNYNNDEAIIVEVISNCAEVELFLNGKSLGVKKLADFEDRIYKWAVPFETGKLMAKGVDAETSIETSGEPVAIKLTADKEMLTANGYDVCHIIAQLVDEKGNPVKTTEKKLSFNIEGEVKSLGVDNGSPENIQSYQSNEVITSNGRAMIIVQSQKTKGKASILATFENVKSEVEILINE